MGGWQVSPNGVYKTLVRHGLNTRAKRLALVAGYRAPFEPPRDPEPEPHIDSHHPGELVGLDCFFVGRLHGAKGPVWQITAIDTYGALPGLTWLFVQHPARPSSTPRRWRAASPQSSNRRAGSSSACSRDNGNEAARPSAHASRPASRTPRSAPAAHRPTATSNDYIARSSKNAGGPPSRATSKSASAACAATSAATYTTTTSTANTTDASPTA